MSAPGALNTALRAVEALWALLVTALVGSLVHRARGVDDSAVVTTLNFALFVAALSWIALLYGLASRFVAAVGHPLVAVLLDASTALFSFISGVTLAARLGVHDCRPLALVPGLERACRMAQASTAFMWFLFACFAATTFLAVKEYRGSSFRRGPSVV